MGFWKKLLFHFESQTTDLSTLCGRNAELMKAKPGDTSVF